ncbi:S-adenosyl-L-methionine dependent methyltransferase [Halteromyces radiatus]|uniref:S-adenosyl-L-methionine dependent methyltransferase n=1 Tax=Halteromyces radiatus TaxID=101107 RepID=UPI00221EDCB4|nr:S-adenosyl-L-methionine dependent methyltransferase [Halteromyces radiatus]KAI8093706.1 S-adenosyl-L-methionine dependent methyltransferase [Halteromyces radiatus]
MGKRQRFDQDEQQEDSVGEMHPRNIYKDNPPDFTALAQQYESFRPFVLGGTRPYIDFKNPEAVRELTCCLLKHDFDLDVHFPLNRLCPPIPNRLNYLLWIEDLLEESSISDNKKNVMGIDIGVGASCIYPLLGCQMHPHWRFLGTELDAESFDYAKKNVDRNGLQDRISLVLNKDENKIFLLDPSIDSYDFCMCNPPFYASQEELQQGLENKELEPSAICTGTTSEMITEDGEYGFIKRMILESKRYKYRIQWYTSMMGLKRTIRPITQLLKQQGITNYVVTEFCQGRTKRWGIAWSFSSTRIVKSKSLESYRPKSQFTVNLSLSLSRTKECLLAILTDLDIPIPSSTSDNTLRISPPTNTWSRAARRLRKRQKHEQQQENTSTPSNLPSLSLMMECSLLAHGDTQCQLRLSWLKGDDRAVFESFWNHVKKRMEQEAGIYTGSTFQPT